MQLQYSGNDDNQFTYMQVANYKMNTPYILGQKKKTVKR